MRDLPLLATMGVGSYATPGWLFHFRDGMRHGHAGSADIDEAFEDATRIAVADQLDAGVDVISDGELRRMRFVYEMYDRMSGLERHAPDRRLGVPGYDRAPHYSAADEVAAPQGLGIVQEFRQLKALCSDRPLKVAFPGPLTFARNIAPGSHYGSGGAEALMADLIAIIQGEIADLAAAGADFIQLDEPGFANPPEGMSVAAGAEAINAALTGHEAITAVHVCFGNNASRPYVRRDFARLFPGLAELDCAMLLLEFANREMADLDRLPELAERYRIAAGVIDVKSYYEESGEEVAERIRRVLEVVPAERLFITADCGFSAIPRWLARRKLVAMVAGAEIVRDELKS
ncbi:MAG: methionine synthase [Alphaproteobacteria bacterium]|jgi:5-methyltetrahydropteroyltriglutamate--homocysteine methyltransferase|nr:methionine synthase [Alphaproteobacteria bacterium]